MCGWLPQPLLLLVMALLEGSEAGTKACTVEAKPSVRARQWIQPTILAWAGFGLYVVCVGEEADVRKLVIMMMLFLRMWRGYYSLL